MMKKIYLATLLGLLFGPMIGWAQCIIEGFEAGVGGPAGWLNGSGGTYNGALPLRTGSFKANMTTAGAFLVTSSVINPNSVSFYMAKSLSGNFTLKIQTATSNSGPFTDQGSVTLIPANPTDVYNLYTVSLATLPPGTYNIRFLLSWTAGSAYIDDVVVNCTVGPEINLKQATSSIVTGGTYNFGNQETSTTSSDIQFDIENLGSTDLTLNGVPDKIAISGTNAADFTITQSAVTSPVSSFTSTSFSISFNPGATGVRTALITISNDDANEASYTFTLTGNGTNNNTSDVAEGSTSYTSNILYKDYQSTPALAATATGTIALMNLQTRDGGIAHNDNDAAATTPTRIRFTVKDPAGANQISQVRHAVLTNASDVVFAVATITGTELDFQNVAGWPEATAADNANSSEFVLKISFNNTGITDKTKFVFKVAGVELLAGSSALAAADGGAAQSDALSTNDKNRIDVVATTLAFLQNANNTATTATMSPSVTVRTVDINGMVDVDYTGSVNITSGGTMDAFPKTAILSGGVATFSNIIHTATHTAKKLTATLGGFTALSVDFDVASTLYTNGSFLSTGGTYATALSWSKCTGGCTGLTPGAGGWGALGAGAPTVGSTAYITGTVNVGAIPASPGSIHVLNGGVLNQNIGTAWTISTLLKVYSGGTVNLNSHNLTIAGTFSVLDGGKVTLNYSGATNTNSNLWAGTEYFEPNSTFEIYNYNNTSNTNTLFDGTGLISANTFNSYTASFGNLLINPAALGGTLILIKEGLGTSLIPVNLCHKNLEFTASTAATNTVTICKSGGNIYTGIGGDLKFIGAAAYTVNYHTGSTKEFTVSGNFLQSNGSFRVTSGTSGSSTLTINGNLSISGGTFEFAPTSTGTAYSSNVNLKGSFATSAGAIFKNSNVNGIPLLSNKFNFTGTTLQEIEASGTFDQVQAFIKSGASVTLKNRNLLLIGGASTGATLTVENGGIFSFGTGAAPLNVTGSGTTQTFAVNAGGTIKITSVDAFGAIRASNVSGNVQTSVRTFDAGGIYHYIGNSNQVTGDGLPIPASGKKVIVEMNTDLLTLTASNTTRFNSSGTLEIRKGKVVDNGSNFFADGTSAGESGNLVMSGGIYQFTGTISTPASTVLYPRLSGTYTLTSGLIDLAATTDANTKFQRLRGGRAYYNVMVSGASSAGGYKNISSTLSVTNDLSIIGTAIFDLTNGGTTNPSITGTGTLTMTGGRYILGADETQPELTGSPYALTDGVVQFARTTPLTTTQSIRTETYKNIEVTGKLVGNSNGNITLNSSGTFNVKNGGIFTINADAIVGPTGTQTVTVENGGVFKTGDADGFSNGTGLTATSIRQDIEAIDLQSGSTVEYTRLGNQPISNLFNLSTPTLLVYHHLIINGTGNKTAPSSTITIQGNLSKSGTSTFVHNAGTVLFNSSTATQSFTNSGTTAFNFFNLTNSNSFSTGLNIVSDLGVVNALILSDGSKLNVNTGNISLRSTSTATARVAPINTGTIAYGTGRFIVERYFPARRSWRLLTAPVTVAGDASFFKTYQLNGIASASAPAGLGTYITGPLPTGAAGNGLDPNPNSINNSSLKTFNASTGLYTDVTNTKLLMTSGTAGTAGAPDNIGFMMFVRGDRTTANVNAFTPGSTVNETTLSDIGKLQIYSYTFPVNPVVGKYALIGNPYASPVDFTALLRNSVANKFWAWDPALNTVGGYAIVDFALGTTTTVPLGGSTSQTKDIQSKQAFIVETSIASAPTVTFNETSKSINNNLLLFRPVADAIRSLAINLHAVNADGTLLMADGALLQYREDLQDEVDTLDAPKFSNMNEMLSIQSNKKALMLERRSPVKISDTIFLNLSKTSLKKYRFNCILNKMTAIDLTAYLEDKFLQTTTPIEMEGSTWTDFSITSDPTSKATDRFRIIFKKVFTCNSIKVAMQNDDIAVNWQVTGEDNIQQYEVERSTDGNNFTTIATAVAIGNNKSANDYIRLDEKPLPGMYYYRIKGISNNGAIGYSQTVQVKMMNSKSSLYVFPNPVTNGTIGLQLNTQPAGNYAVRLINAAGQIMLTKTVTHAGGTASVAITYPGALKGSYQLEVTHPDKKVKLVKIILQ